jgi:hypothetical protein
VDGGVEVKLGDSGSVSPDLSATADVLAPSDLNAPNDISYAKEANSPDGVPVSPDLGVALNDAGIEVPGINPGDASPLPGDSGGNRDTVGPGGPDTTPRDLSMDTVADSGGGVADLGIDSASITDASAPVVDPDLVLWYTFDNTVSDSSPGGAGRSAVLTSSTSTYAGKATFTTDSQMGTHALNLTPASTTGGTISGYATIPAPQTLAPDAVTFAFWVKLTANTSAENWERIFDFGNGSTGDSFLYLTARASDATNTPLRFGISNTGHVDSAEERLESPSMLSARVWHHVAIVLPMPSGGNTSYTGSLYVDGAVVKTNPSMTLHMSDVGATTLNWLGRSPFTGDPTFNGSLDDFRLYKRALSATEIAALYQVR